MSARAHHNGIVITVLKLRCCQGEVLKLEGKEGSLIGGREALGKQGRKGRVGDQMHRRD